MMKPKACYVVFVLSVLLGDQSWSVSGGDNTVMATAKQFLLLYSGNFLKEDVLGSTHRSLEIFSFNLFAFSPLYVGVNSSFMSETTSRKNGLLRLHGHD